MFVCGAINNQLEKVRGIEGTESKVVGRGCSVVTSVGLRGVDGVLFVESDPVRNDGVDAHRARGVSLFRPRQQQQQRPIIREEPPRVPPVNLAEMISRLWRAMVRTIPLWIRFAVPRATGPYAIYAMAAKEDKLRFPATGRVARRSRGYGVFMAW